MLAAGTYRARPVRAALGVTGTGKEQIGVLFDLVDPPGERITWYGYFTEGTFDRTIESLRAIGWSGTDLAEFQGDIVPQGFDREVELVVKQEEYNGKVSAKVAFINSGGGLAMKDVLAPDAARVFAAQMKGRIAALDHAQGGAPARSARAMPAGTSVPQGVLDAQEESNTSGEDIDF